MLTGALAIPTRELTAVCERYGVLRLSLFGSALTGAMTDESDIDLLVEFSQGRSPGLRFETLAQELSDLLGRRVDLNTPGFLSRYFRDDVMATAKVLYAA